MKIGTILLGAVLILALTAQAAFGQGYLQVPLPGKAIPKFVDPLPTFVGARVKNSTFTVTMQESQQPVLPASVYAPLAPLFNAGTFVWTYNVDGRGALYPAFTIEATKGTETNVTYVNNITSPRLLDQGFAYNLNLAGNQTAILPYDQSLHWADPLGAGHIMTPTPYTGPVPAVVHLHGGEVPSAYDGGPDSWFTPGKTVKGPGYVTDTYRYPNQQEAATLFFHDHALGVTRLNLYAGLAGFYFIRDGFDNGIDDGTGKSAVSGLPAGPYEIELAIQDRSFDTNGQLYFPNAGINTMDHPYWIPEFFGDVIVVNGKSWPFLDVEPRRYRFRIVNGSNARFYEMRLWNIAAGTAGPVIWQIGSDGGFLDIPAKSDPNVNPLLLAPGERADVIVDFAGFAGQTLTLKNSAKAPFPKGTAADPQTVGQIMQFRVSNPLPPPTNDSYDPATATTSLRSTLVVQLNAATTNKRRLTLNEVMGMGGPLEVLVNNAKWDAATTETPQVGSTEVWEIVNMTADAHPIHLHLVQFQLVNRQAFNNSKYTTAYNALFPGGKYIGGYGPPLAYNTLVGGAIGGNPDVTRYLQGPVKLPNPNEKGWKDTFVMYPGEVTRVVIRWTPQDVPAGSETPGASQFVFDPTAPMGTPDDGLGFPGGPGYVWHCHIVDHEDNEMMRRQIVTTVKPAGFAKVALAENSEPGTPQAFSLEQNYPNPFNPSTEIRFSIPEDSPVRLTVYNELGQEVSTLIDQVAPAGQHTVKLDASKLASGVYFYRIQAGTYTAMKKMVLMK